MAQAKKVAKVKDIAPLALVDSFESHASEGLENVTAKDLAIPFLTVLQSNSPQCKSSHGKYIDGAQEGNILNTVTEETFDEGIIVIPCGFLKNLVEWVPRVAGGGYVTAHSMDSGIREQASTQEVDGKQCWVLPNGNHIVETAYHYVLLSHENGAVEQCVIGMSSTQLRNSRRWLSLISGMVMQNSDGEQFTPPMYAHKYKLSTVVESKQDNTWMGWKIDVLDPLQEQDLFDRAVTFNKAISQGLVQVAPPPAPGTVDNDIPM